MDISFWNLVPCYSTHTEPGLCLSTAICAAIGGTPSGSCMYRMSMSKTCCIINSNRKNPLQKKQTTHFKNKNSFSYIEILTTCSANVVANNTYWQSPLFGVDSGSLCIMALHLNTGVIRQNLQPICQVRYTQFMNASTTTTTITIN